MSAESKGWALILGASSGFGGATARELAKNGFDVFGVHLDMRATLPNAEAIQKDIEAAGRRAIFFNVNAADAGKRAVVMQRVIEETAKDGSFVRVVLHSLAFGALQPVIGDDPKSSLSQRQLEMTLDVMANSLLYWVQDLVSANLIRRGSRVFAMTSSGSTRVMKSYGAISAAKAALESNLRQLALELAPIGATANAIRAGVTDTPALRKIPGAEHMIAEAAAQNPHGRLGTTGDVARCMVALADAETAWMTGNTIRVDGGEDFVGSRPPGD